jgi:FlaA1/EpsC-like NDP-sugar epimerase
MFENFKGTSPRWMIFGIDMFLSVVALVIAYQLRFNFDVPVKVREEYYLALPYFIVIRSLGFFLGKTYTGMIRYTGFRDSLRVLVVVFFTSLTMGLINLVVNEFFGQGYLIPFTILIIEFLLVLFFIVLYRLVVKLTFYEIKTVPDLQRKIIIYGAGDKGIITARTLSEQLFSKNKLVAYIDDNKRKSGKTLDNTKVYHSRMLEKLLKSNNVDELIIAIENIDKRAKQKVINVCLKYGVKVLTVPPFQDWIGGELTEKQIKTVKIEDLLGRDEIYLEQEKVNSFISNKTVMVSGAAGSIGSELVRQLIQFNPSKIVLVDQAESDLYDFEVELLTSNLNVNIELAIADVSDFVRISHVFDFYKPKIVFHAAAYKHVPLMEKNPAEAIRVNVLGTINMAKLANEYGSEVFTMVSTDKAVNPTNVMGASKRIAEIYIQSLNKNSKTNYVTTRFGNVLGSNGSVIPLFKKQIENGGPLTVTHPDITRYFMTIPEACLLVLEAASMGKGGEIFVFDMGEAIKINDLALNMIKLSGLEPEIDIKIKYSGLREGEKLYEELLNSQETTAPTHNPKIMIGKVQEFEFDEVNVKVEKLTEQINNFDNFTLVKLMKGIVPEFKSKNSIYSELD